MDTKNNLYELLDVTKSASSREILGAYENKITKFNNTLILSDNQISEIKMLKVALHVLITPELKNKYNQYLEFKNKKQNKLLNKNHQNEPQAVNQEMESSLDILFNVDNTWMSNDSRLNDTSSGKNKFDNNSIGDRVFSMSHFNKRPGYSSDFEALAAQISVSIG
jgi:DnaJ-class molecular chaperone